MSKVEIKNESSMPTPSREYLPHLVVYVVWHPRNLAGSGLARALYTELAGDPDDPTSEGVGVPVYYRTGTPGARLPMPIPLAKVTKSGVTPQFSNPQKVVPVRPNPVWTSSATQSPPCFRIIS